MGTMYGYARVSSRDQNLDRQMVAFARAGVSAERVFVDKASGKDFDRAGYRRMVAAVRPGDVVVLDSIDRLGRNYGEMLEEWRQLTLVIGVDVVVLDFPLLDTRQGPDGVTGILICDIVLRVLSYVAHIEREHILQRQAEGIAAAREKGKHLGRPAKEKPACFAEVCDAYLRRKIGRAEAIQRLGVSTSTFYRWLGELRQTAC